VGNSQAPGTSISLLDRLRLTPDDPAAWRDFSDRYTAVIYDWCRHWRLQDADARDVTQMVMLKLIRRLRTFEYDPKKSFRNWLRKVAHDSWADFLTEQSRSAANGVALSRLDELPSREDLLRHLDAEFDREVLEEAFARVQVRVEPRTWEAFRLTALEGVSGVEAARQLGTSIANVFKAKSNLLKLLGEEVRRLEGTEPPE
jgi:RNA polymerase sigma factor (sigma-70 family)